MTTINNGKCKLARTNNVVTVELICSNVAEADAIFFTLMQTIREDHRLELTFAGLGDLRYQGERIQ